MDNFIEFAPYIIIIVCFLIQYQVFVTPAQLQKVIDDKLEKYVLKETYDITVQQIKDDVSEIKTKVDKIFDKVMGG